MLEISLWKRHACRVPKFGIHDHITLKPGEVAFGVWSKKDDSDSVVALRIQSIICSFYKLKQSLHMVQHRQKSSHMNSSLVPETFARSLFMNMFAPFLRHIGYASLPRFGDLPPEDDANVTLGTISLRWGCRPSRAGGWWANTYVSNICRVVLYHDIAYMYVNVVTYLRWLAHYLSRYQ